MASNKKSSVVWDHFSDIGGFQATCNICNMHVAKSSVTNLKRHLDRKHPTVRVLNRTEVASTTSTSSSGVCIGPGGGGGEMTNNGNDASGVSRNVFNSNVVACSSGTSQVPLRRTYGHQAITEYLPKRRGNLEKSLIDSKVMQLFSLDFQPFRMVEDRGFRELMSLAFPNYIIPTRKYFANNMLPALYEKKTELKASVEKDVKSLCVTVDIWSTLANDAMMAITGHYIEEEKCELRYCLLDCVPLTESHTAKNLAKVIKQVCDEWQVSNKILLGVSDNGSNIKNAIEKELGWKHFPCYTHTLNLAVNDALKAEDLVDILTKLKGIVRQFKQSNVAWLKLKTYQEQAGNKPKRLIQEVITRWNSKFYMIQRCVELKEPLNSAMINLGMETLTAYEWQVCHELCVVLGPCEEVTRELSGEKYVTGSLVIPITTGLVKSLQNLGNDHTFIPVVDRVRQDIIGGVLNRFSNLKLSRTFTNCMFLDPRFKLYFEDPSVAEDTKRRMIALVVQEQNHRGEGTAPVATESTTENLTNPVCQPINSIWQDYQNKMANIQPDGTAHSRAIVEVQRYLDDKIINRHNCPLKWWTDHKTVYPHLYKIAVQKLNAMASSVSCERVFSAAGAMINERRTRLGIRKLQQLVFLNQNM